MDQVKPLQSDVEETLPRSGDAAGGSGSLWTPAPDGDFPTTIGGYRVLGLLGQGGMGQVYLAEQETPRRTVALKVVRAGPGSEHLVKRFLHEVSVLGLLKHPGIAQIYDAGIAESQGRSQPYFAMELVKGRPLCEHAEAEGLRARERLDLFARVCDAVQHAHHKGVIHRDLKPGNILVEENGQPKVLDFGVARATNHDVQAVTLQTDVGQLVGTLPYMSPEQVTGDPAELDTRSDVYTLGVVLFELLTGKLPHAVASRAITEAIRVVSEQDAPRLSTVDRVWSGDVETIVAKALERDKSRRYQSAGDLAEDIRRHLRCEPILARPPSTMYQISRFARRNKPLVVASLISLLALVAGVAGVSWQAVSAERARHRAAATSEFLETVLASADPGGADGRDARVVDILRKASQRLSEQAALPQGTRKQDYRVTASLHNTIGSTYVGLGLYGEAEGEFRKAYQVYSERRGENSPLSLEYLNNIAFAVRHQGRLDEAEALQREAYEKRRRVLGEDHEHTLIAADNLATVLRRQGKLREASDLYREVLALRERHPGVNRQQVLDTRNNLGLVLRDMGMLEEAEGIFRQTLQQKERVYGAIKPDHPEVLTTRHNLARVLADQGRLREARELLTLTLEARERELGPGHSITLFTKSALADVIRQEGDAARAEEMLRESLAALLAQGGDMQATTLMTRDYLAAALCAQRKFEEGAEEAGEAVAASIASLGRDHWLVADFKRTLGWALAGLGKTDEAERVLCESIRGLTNALGPVHWRTRASFDRLGELYDDMGRSADAASARAGVIPDR